MLLLGYSHESEEATRPTTKRKWHGYHYNTTTGQGQSMMEDSTELYSDKRHRYNHSHHHQATAPTSAAGGENTWQQDLSSHEVYLYIYLLMFDIYIYIYTKKKRNTFSFYLVLNNNLLYVYNDSWMADQILQRMPFHGNIYPW